MTKQKLDWQDIRKIGSFDSVNRWYPIEEIREYFASIRSPSREWPYSYAKAAMTKKFAKWLRENRAEIAGRFGL